MTATKEFTNREQCTVGWIAPLWFELTAARAVLDEVYELNTNVRSLSTDENAYVYGRIGSHFIAIACLPVESYGTTNTTATAMEMQRTFPRMEFVFLVGIGAGVSNESNAIRLGDVAIGSGGVFQHDLVKAQGYVPDQWQRMGILNRPPTRLRNAVTAMVAKHQLCGNGIPEIMNAAMERWPELIKNHFANPDVDRDGLFGGPIDSQGSAIDAPHNAARLESSGPTQSVKHPKVYCGVIASGNMVVKDSNVRDEIARSGLGCICLEMEAAGLPHGLQSLVIRGISDYGDANKCDKYQRYAAMAAAACAKELLSFVSLLVCTDDGPHFTPAPTQAPATNETRRRLEILDKLNEACPSFELQKHRLAERAPNTCEWFTEHRTFRCWRDDPTARLLLLTAGSYRGKSVLAKHLIDAALANPGAEKGGLLYYFFSTKDGSDSPTAPDALRSLLVQLFHQRPYLLSDNLVSRSIGYGPELYRSTVGLWNLLLASTTIEHSDPIICIIDGLNECEEKSGRELTDLMCQHAKKGHSNKRSILKILATSRPDLEITRVFESTKVPPYITHLDGDAEVAHIIREIAHVIDIETAKLSKRASLPQETWTKLRSLLNSNDNSTYCWTSSILREYRSCLSSAASDPDQILPTLDSSAESAILNMLGSSPSHNLTARISRILLTTYRPLTVTELYLALHLMGEHAQPPSTCQQWPAEHEIRELIRDSCSAFVIRDDSTVCFIHSKVRDLLLSNPTAAQVLDAELSNKSWIGSLSLAEAHASMSKVCARYLKMHEPIDDEFAIYCRYYLCAHLSESDLGPDVLDFQEFQLFFGHRLAVYWNGIIENSPQSKSRYERYCPRKDDGLLTLTAYLGVRPVVEALLRRRKLDVNGKTAVGWSALHLAAFNGHIQVMKVLIGAGADINIQGQQKRTPLWAAIEGGSEQAVRTLLESHCQRDGDDEKEDCSPLVCAVRMNSTIITQLLLDYGATTSFPDPHWRASEIQLLEPPLAIAIKSGNYALVRLLLKHETDPSANLRYGNNARIAPVMLAIQEDQIDIVGLLIKYEARFEEPLNIGIDVKEYPLAAAARANNVKICSLLLSKGAKIDAERSAKQGTALSQAVSAWSYDAIKLLLSYGAKVDKKTMKSLSKAFPSTSIVKNNRNKSKNAPDLSTKQDELSRSIAQVCLWHYARITEDVLPVVVETWQKNTHGNISDFWEQILGVLEYAQQNWTYVQKYNERQRLVYIAIDSGHFALAKALIVHERSLQRLDNEERRILIILAASSGDDRLLLDLCKSGHFDPNITHPLSGRTPLSLTVSYGRDTKETDIDLSSTELAGYRSITKTLLARGADRDKIDIHGRRAADWAEQCGNTWYSELLSQRQIARKPIASMEKRLGSMDTVTVTPKGSLSKSTTGSTLVIVDSMTERCGGLNLY